MRLTILTAAVFAIATAHALAHDDEPIGDGIRDVPLFDAHMHYKEPAWGPYPVKSVIELMDRNGV
ncbi:MAG: amidohydrolase, partial [Alphaproteobacteria bacterium]|nr:amidohydrolase [Alphaproteobacteria bacterium]